MTIEHLTKEEQERAKLYLEQKNKKIRKRRDKTNVIKQSLFVIIFTPISIGFRVISFPAKVIGCITSIGLPYGLYCLYIVIKKMTEGIPWSDIDKTLYVWIFVILPFVAFAVHVGAEKLSEYFANKL